MSADLTVSDSRSIDNKSSSACGNWNPGTLLCTQSSLAHEGAYMDGHGHNSSLCVGSYPKTRTVGFSFGGRV